MLRPLLAAALLASCAPQEEDPGAPTDAVAPGVVADALAPDALAPDAAPPPDLGPPPCATRPTPGVTFELDPDGPDTQIHANAAFDGARVWVAYNVPRGDESGGFDVRLTRLACDGTPTPPVPVSTTPAGNHVDPVVAVGAERALVAWHTDDQMSEYNLSVRYRVLTREGEPLGDAEGRLPSEQNAWMPAVAPLAGSGFGLVGAHGDPGAMGWQVFSQRFDPAGEPEGAPRTVRLTPEATQSAPTLAGDLIAWTEAVGEDPEHVVFTHLDPATGELDPDPPEAVGGSASALPNAAAAADGRVYLAYTVAASDLDVQVTAGGDPVTLGAPGRDDHSPAVAPADDGAAVAWYRRIRGIQNEIYVARLRLEAGGALVAGDPIAVPTDEPAAPYAPAFVYVGGDLWLLAWAEGRSPAFRLKGRFIELPP